MPGRGTQETEMRARSPTLKGDLARFIRRVVGYVISTLTPALP